MSHVIQCDGCSKVIDYTDGTYCVDFVVERGESTIASASAKHACSKACVRALAEQVVKKVETSR